MNPIQTNLPNKNMYQPQRGRYHALFPTPFFQGVVNQPHNQIAEYCRYQVSQAKMIEPENNETNYTTYFHQDLRREMEQEEWFRVFANQMKDSYIDFITTQFDFDIKHIRRHDIHFFAWVSVYNKPHQHELHNHVKSRISGTYYPFAQDEVQPIKFVNPNITTTFNHGAADTAMSTPEDEQIMWVGSKGAQSEIHFTPKTGDFLLWPSYIMHGVPRVSQEYSDDYERIAISFNLNHKEDLGAYETGDDMDYSFIQES